MADKLVKPVGVRLDEETYNFYNQLATEDERELAVFLRRILQKVKEKNLVDMILSKEAKAQG